MNKEILKIKESFYPKNIYGANNILILEPQDALEYIKLLLPFDFCIIGFETWHRDEMDCLMETQEGEFFEYFKGEYNEFINLINSKISHLPKNIAVEIYIKDKY